MLLLLAAFAFAEDLWAVAPAEGVRWPDVTAVSLRLAEGDKVEVLVRDGEKVRVRKGTDFGWVAATALTNVEPAAPAGLGLEGFPDFKLTTPDGTPIESAPAESAPAAQ